MNQRLTIEQARNIITRVAAGELQKNLAEEFGINPSTVSNLIRGKSWPDLDRPDPPETTMRGTKLTAKDIPCILSRLSQQETPQAIATDYGVTRQAIADIKRGKTWGHIPRFETKRRRRVWEQIG